MRQQMLVLLLYTGFVSVVRSATRKYYLVQDGMNWTDARDYCQSTHTDLAVIKSSDDMVHLQNEADSQLFNSYAWIGMFINQYACHWSYGYEPLGSLMFWEDGEPNDRWGDQYCGAITPWGWWDLECYELRPYVCFDDTKTGSDRYIYIEDRIMWPDAQASCRQTYTDLASAKDANENAIIQNMIPGAAWFGLFKDGWKWVDKTSFSYVPWKPGKPDNSWGNEDCGYLETGEAVDSQCIDVMPFFCYSATAKKQTIRLKIRSDQDLNGPAVNEDILEKIKQKLMDHGMDEDVTLKWSVQPDGLVFHKTKRN